MLLNLTDADRFHRLSFNCLSNNIDRLHMKLLRKKPYDSELYGTAASTCEEILFLFQTMLIQKGFTVCCFLARTIRRQAGFNKDAVFAQTNRRQTGFIRCCFLLKLTGGRQASQDAVCCSNKTEARQASSDAVFAPKPRQTS